MAAIDSELRPLEGFKIGRYPLKYEANRENPGGQPIKVIVSPGGALLTQFQIESGLGDRLYLPEYRLIAPRKPAPETKYFLDAINIGMIPAHILPWTDNPKFLSDTAIHRVCGYTIMTELLIYEAGFRQAPLVIDPAKQTVVEIATQYYQAHILYPKKD